MLPIISFTRMNGYNDSSVCRQSTPHPRTEVESSVLYSRDPLIGAVDEDGRLVLPPELVRKLGLRPGDTVPLDQEPNSIRVRRPVRHLAKVYVEPTSRGDLACRTCVRHAWEEPLGDMSEETFERLLEGLRACDPAPAVFFGGFGEPLVHPRITEMVCLAKEAGAPAVDLITNGCLLDEQMSRDLIEAGLDTLWVSLDGIKPESYSDVRLGALLPDVLDNLKQFKAVRREIQLPGLTPKQRRRYDEGIPGLYESWRLPEPRPALGIVFVAMKRNIADLPALIGDTHRLGARKYVITNVYPYTSELADEMLCADRLSISPFPTLWNDRLRLAQMDIDEDTRPSLHAAVRSFESGLAEEDTSNVTRRCPFVEAGATAVSWKGEVVPCLPLMRSHYTVLNNSRRRVHSSPIGDLARDSLGEIWSGAEYVDFRERVQAFEFAPCVACGGCLWSQGLIRCP